MLYTMRVTVFNDFEYMSGMVKATRSTGVRLAGSQAPSPVAMDASSRPLLLLLPILCRRASSAALSHTGGFRVGGGVHDSYTFQCGLVGSFTSPGIDSR